MIGKTMTRTRSTRPSRKRLRTSDALPMVRIGVSSIALSAGTAVSTGSATTVVFAHVSGGCRVLENTILGSSAIRGKVGSSPPATI
jgi:hypothetical protein